MPRHSQHILALWRGYAKAPNPAAVRTRFYDFKLLGYFFSPENLLEHDFIYTIFCATPILALDGRLM